jgi:EndoU nuclease-like protein
MTIAASKLKPIAWARRRRRWKRVTDHAHEARRPGASPVPAQTSPKTGRTPPGETANLSAALNDSAKARSTAQLRRSLTSSPRAVQLAQVARAVQRSPSVVQRLPLTDAMWTHIARGELREGNKKLVGYHWTGDANAIAEKNGESKQGPDERGVYVEGVQSRSQFGQGKSKGPITKAKASTFWPDAWTEAEIKDAIANGGTASRNVSEVSTKAAKSEARGMRLFVNPDSVFPVIEETETESRGGRKKGAGRGKK